LVIDAESHVSVPKIISGLLDEMSSHRDSLLANTLWKFTTKDLIMGVSFCERLRSTGDEQQRGEPMSVVLSNAESLLSDDSAPKLFLVPAAKDSNRLVENCGIPQLQQIHDALVFASASNTREFIPRQSLWYQSEQLSQAMPGLLGSHFTAF